MPTYSEVTRASTDDGRLNGSSWTTADESIFIGKSNFQGINGMIVSMSDSGFLQIGYLGTDQLT